MPLGLPLPAQDHATFWAPFGKIRGERAHENKGNLKCTEGTGHPHFFGYQLWIPSSSREKSVSVLSSK